MTKSEQWWELGLYHAGETIRLKSTRSRRVRDRWIRDGLPGHQATAYYRERWSIGGRFDGEVYQSGPVTLVEG